ncbi:MAG: BatA domain-containing protein [Gemmataceae bacterium]
MSFVFPAILGGLVLAGIPVLLHLILRQKPKTIPFPAFRFLVQKHRTNQRKLQLRHLLLLLMRIGLLVLLTLALARPRFFHEGLGLGSEKPAAALMLFDTTPSMEWASSEGMTRLDEAKKRAIELVDALPAGSKFCIADVGDGAAIRGEWLQGTNLAKQRIRDLKIRPGGASMSTALPQTLRIFAEAARSTEDERLRQMPRILVMFSDRTRGSWQASQDKQVLEAADLVPPSFEGLTQARGELPALIDDLKQVRTKLPPPAGVDYPDASLIETLAQLRDRIPSLRPNEFPPPDDVTTLVNQARRSLRDMSAAIKSTSDEGKETRAELQRRLGTMGQAIAGFQTLWIDVGIDPPLDVALLGIDFPRGPDGRPRELYGADETFVLRVEAQALGQDVSTTIECSFGSTTYRQPFVGKAGERGSIPFEIDLGKLKLPPGKHAIEAKLATADGWQGNNRRFATFEVRQPRRVLILADAPAKAEDLAWALQANQYDAETKLLADLPKLELTKYFAVYLFEPTAPSPEAWGRLEDYAKRGGGVGIVPPGDEIKLDAWKTPAALKVLPGTLTEIVAHKVEPKRVEVDVGATWNFDDPRLRTLPLLKPFKQWKEDASLSWNTIDFIKFPRGALKYWNVTPREKDDIVLTYADAKQRPAILERKVDAGKVVLFTTPLDLREPRWNNYLESLNSFYVVIVGITTRYLAGDVETFPANFEFPGEEPRLRLGPTVQQPALTIRGPGVLETVQVPEKQPSLTVKTRLGPGNYEVFGSDQKGQPLTRFSVNLTQAEADVSRVPSDEIEAVFGPGSIVVGERQTDLKRLLEGRWHEPVELFPVFMLAILFLLAIENLLSNKFYRQEATA